MPVSRHLVLATVTGFPDTHVAYPYCLCCYSKLLKDQNQDCWLCCKCGQSCRSEQVEWRYRLALTITDGDTIASVCLFGSMLDQFFGSTATQFKRYLLRLESSCDHSDQLLKRAVEQSFIGHSYYFGFKTSGAINRQGPNAPITLRQLVSSSEPKCQTSHESVSHVVAFQILPSTTTPQVTVLDLMQLDLQKKSSEISPSQYVESHFTTEQNCSPVQNHGAKTDPSVTLRDGYRSGEDDSDSTRSPSFVSVCASSFGQDTALLSCDMSKSVSNISCVELSQHHGTNTCDENTTKSRPHRYDSSGKVRTEQLSSIGFINSENAQQSPCMNKSSSLGIQGSSASHELMELRSQRLDSSGYISLLKGSVNLDGNLKEFSRMDESLNQGSWNKENIGDNKPSKETVKENYSFSGSLNNSSILLACNMICTTKTSAKPLLKSGNVDRRSLKSEHPLSKGNLILASKSALDDVSCLSNVQSGCCHENYNTGDRIKDRFKQFTSSKNIRNRKERHDKKQSFISEECTSDQPLMCVSSVAPVENTTASRVLISDRDKNSMEKGKIPVLIPDTKMENNNPTVAFPYSEDMWAYLTDEEELCNIENITNLGTSHTTVQSRGGNYVTENVNISSVHKSRSAHSSEEDSDETFGECFDPEFLNLVEQDASDFDETACKPNENIDTGTHDSDGDIDTIASTHNSDDSDEDVDTGTHDSDEDINTIVSTHNSDEDVNTGAHDSDEDADTGTHNSDEDIDTGTHDSDDSDEDVDTRTHNSDEDIDTGMHKSDEETNTGTHDSDIDTAGTCDTDDEVDPSVTQDFDEKRRTTGMHGSHEGLDTAGTVYVDGGAQVETYHTGYIIESANKSRTELLTSSQVCICTSMTARSVTEKHSTDHCTTLDTPETVAKAQGGLEPMPDSEDLYAFLDSTFGDVTGEQSLNIPTHVLSNKEGAREKAGDHSTEKKEIFEDLGKKITNKITVTQQFDDADIEKKLCSVSESYDPGNLNCAGRIENVRMKTNFKDKSRNRVDVLTSDDETLEHLESMFDDSFDGVETGNEDQVHSSQETVFVQCLTHSSNSTRNTTVQSPSKSDQHNSYSKRENVHSVQDKADSSCSSANTVKFVSGLIDLYNGNIHHGRENSIHDQHCQDLHNQDPCSQYLPIQDNLTQDIQSPDIPSQVQHSQDIPSQVQHSQDISGQHLLSNDDQHPINENRLSRDQSCVLRGVSFSFNASTDLFGCSGNSSVALCNDTYSQSLTYDDGRVAHNRVPVEAARTAICSPVREDEQQEKGKTVQFARRLSCVKTIQLIDIEMKMRQNPGLKLPVMPKSCLKLQVASPCSPLCLKRDAKKPKLSKVFSLRKQEKLESQDLFSCSIISENSCDVINPMSILHVPGGTEDVFYCNDGIPGTQDLFTPSPVQMSNSMSSDCVLGSASCNRLGKKFKFPTWTKKPSHWQSFVSTPLEGYTEKLCTTEKEPIGLVSPSLSQGNEDSFAQNSASLFLDSFDDLRVTNTSTHVVKHPCSLEDSSLISTKRGKRKDISPICVGFSNPIRGDNHIQTGEVTLDTGTPDLFETSNVSASTSGFRSNRKIQRSSVATNFTFPVKRLFLD